MNTRVFILLVAAALLAGCAPMSSVQVMGYLRERFPDSEVVPVAGQEGLFLVRTRDGSVWVCGSYSAYTTNELRLYLALPGKL